MAENKKKVETPLKRLKQDAEKRLRNRARKSQVRVAFNKLTAVLAGGTKEEASKAYSEYCSTLDKAAKTGAVHKNKASRKKSDLAQRLTS